MERASASTVKTAFITGASSGIGAATARELAKAGYRLVLCGRRQERLDELAAEVGVDTQILTFDVADKAGMEAAWATLPTDWQVIDVLLNNAGNAHGMAPIHEGDTDDWDAMIDSNIRGVLYLTRLITPGMVERRSGHVINLGSIAGRAAYANGNVYCATKAAVDLLTDGMRIDLNPFGIKVTNIEPGLVETEFSLVRFKGDEARAAKPYEGLTPLVAQDIAEAIAWVVTRPAHVVIADMVLMPVAQASATVYKRN